jgi:hypothetical protein
MKTVLAWIHGNFDVQATCIFKFSLSPQSYTSGLQLKIRLSSCLDQFLPSLCYFYVDVTILTLEKATFEEI